MTSLQEDKSNPGLLLQKALSQMLDWVLNTPGLYNMVETLAQQNSMINPYSKNVSE